MIRADTLMSYALTRHPLIDAAIDTHGVRTVLRVALVAALTPRPRVDLENPHLRRDVGLPPVPDPSVRRPMF